MLPRSHLTWPAACLAFLALWTRLPAAQKPAPGQKDNPAKGGAEPKERLQLKHEGKMVIAVQFSPDGKRLASGGWDMLVRVWDPLTGKEERQFKGHSQAVFTVAWSPDGKRLASGGDDTVLRVWDVATGKEERQFKGHSGGVVRVAWSPDGKFLASASYDGSARVWDLATGKDRQLETGHGTIYSVAISPDSKLVAVGRGNGTVVLYDAVTAKELRQLEKKGGNVWYLAFSPDGKTLATADQGGGSDPLNLWEAATGKHRGTFPGHAGICTVAYSRDGRTLATGSGDGTIRLWEAATGTERVRIGKHNGVVPMLSFTPDTKTLATASHDGTIRIWDMAGVPVKGLAAKKRTAAELDAMWETLIGQDGKRAYQVIRELGQVPEQSIPLFKKELDKLVAARPEIDPRQIEQYVAELDHQRYKVRERASEELARVGLAALPALRRALEGKPSLEQRRRIEFLLERLQPTNVPPEEMRWLRAIEVLETVGSKEARQLLQTLAKKAYQDRLVLEAKTSLERLTLRPVTP
jgi:tricorn protease-like protein